MQTDNKLYRKLNRHLQEYKTVYEQRQPLFRELRAFVHPYLGRFDGERPNRYKPDTSKQLRGLTNRCLHVLAAGMQAGLTSPSRDWFKLVPEERELQDDYALKKWCRELHDLMLRIFAASNFYTEVKKLYKEIALFGTGCMIILPDFETVATFQTMTAGSYYLGLGRRGKVDRFYRRFVLSAEELLAEFGKEALPERIIREAEDMPATSYTICHAIEADDSPKRLWRYVSAYWIEGGTEGEFLNVSGYRSFPVMAPRWEVTGGDIYGIGPGETALADVKQFQVMIRDLNIAVKKEIDPPLIASEALRNSNVRTTPHGITFVNVADVSGGQIISPMYSTSVNLNDLRELIAETTADIQQSFFYDLFLMLHSSDDKQKTATEVQSLELEKAMMLGPVIESMINDLLDPAIDRLYEIMQAAGIVPEAPESVQGISFTPEYISVLAQAQKLQSVRPVEQLLGYAGTIAAAYPNIFDNIDLDKTIRQLSDAVGAPADIMRPPDEVEKIRQQQAQQQAEEQQKAEAAAIAEQIPNVAKGAELLSTLPQNGADIGAIIGTQY